MHLARLAVLVALLQFHLVTPTSPVDPAIEPAVRLAALNGRHQETLSQVKCERLQSIIVTGGPRSAAVRCGETALGRLSAETSKLAKHLVHRPKDGCGEG